MSSPPRSLSNLLVWTRGRPVSSVGKKKERRMLFVTPFPKSPHLLFIMWLSCGLGVRGILGLLRRRANHGRLGFISVLLSEPSGLCRVVCSRGRGL